jgi:predicted O-methyltransferase YrrM
MNLPELYNLQSAWVGHEKFAEWLVNRIQPEVTVDLGVDYGFSLFALALPKIGTVYGIDSFEADVHAGHHEDNYDVVMNFKEKHNFTNVEVVKGWFSEVAKTWDKPIDILHIDGLHTYAAITEDWTNWSKFVKPTGVIIMHDVISFPELTSFFNNNVLARKAFFAHSAGLGIAVMDEQLLQDILTEFPNCIAGNI